MDTSLNIESKISHQEYDGGLLIEQCSSITENLKTFHRNLKTIYTNCCKG